MKKTKKTKAAKAPKKQTLLGGAAKSLRKLKKGTKRGFGSLSTTQKVVGGVALAAVGLGLLAKRLGDTDIPSPTDATTTPDDATVAEANLAAMDENA